MGGDPFQQQTFNDGLDDEEREHLRQVEQEQAERMRRLGEKQQEEFKLKRERKGMG